MRIAYVVVLLFFFFFKQKTAYEMRISDWSSDVCSSDLCAPPALSWPPSFLIFRPKPSSARTSKGSPLLLRRRGASCFSFSVPPLGKIGRASCRERVCQYV